MVNGLRLQGPRGRVYAITPQTELVNQSVIHGMFMLSRLWAKILFDSIASHSFVATSSVDVLSLEVETLDESLHVSSPLGTKVRIDKIYRDCELEISGILLTVDLRIMDISDFDVILGMDWLTAHRVFIDYDRRWVTAYTQDGIVLRLRGISMMLYPQNAGASEKRKEDQPSSSSRKKQRTSIPRGHSVQGYGYQGRAAS